MVVLKDAHVDLWPAPCGAVVIAAHLGLRVSRVVVDGFLTMGLPVFEGTPAADLDTAFRRFGRSLRWVCGYPDTLPPLTDFLDDRVPILQVAPFVVWVLQENTVDSHWIGGYREWIAVDGQWERIEDAPVGKWWVRAAWWVKGR
jgi:hypothetical protein